jgi:hypothetical protein
MTEQRLAVDEEAVDGAILPGRLQDGTGALVSMSSQVGEALCQLAPFLPVERAGDRLQGQVRGMLLQQLEELRRGVYDLEAAHDRDRCAHHLTSCDRLFRKTGIDEVEDEESGVISCWWGWQAHGAQPCSCQMW